MPTFYRVVKTNPPTEADFLSYQALGIPLRRDTPALRRSWEGVSVEIDLDAAREVATLYSAMGSFIAILDVTEGGPVSFEQTGRRPTHYDLHGDPGIMLAMVVAVEPV